MRLINILCLYFIIGVGSAKANLINYQFNTLNFTDNHQVTGSFSYNTDDDVLVALSISLFGPDFNIDFDIDDLTSPDAFSVSFDNMTFGDSANEGFALFKNDVELVTGEYGLGDYDTCYFGSISDACTGNLFTFQSATVGVDAPQPIYLLAFGLVLLFRGKILS
ncbi:hypothetical protein [uncultured Paraglaciecola sp.]|uniref:hypothetical protein n=1 Tax=uncultured Paraglaciecola sp. TaxID=1765024 RepID=UPI0030DB0F71|tara:strand:- start:57648 stop:58139 length:492 start_codon:yes stop_codon:yes gene_type:complete